MNTYICSIFYLSVPVQTKTKVGVNPIYSEKTEKTGKPGQVTLVGGERTACESVAR